MGYLPWGFWETAWRFWPVILILIGIEAIVLGRGRWGLAGALVTIVVVIAIVGAFATAFTPWITPIERTNALNMPAFHLNFNNGEFGPMISGSGVVISENKDVRDFNEVRISGPFVAEIVYGDTYRTTITADDNIMQNVKVEKNGSELRIGLNGVSVIGNSTLKARIEMPDLKGVALSGATKAEVGGFESIRDFEAQISGASRLDGNLNSNVMNLNLSGASTVGIKGTTNILETRLSGASRMDMESFTAKDASIKASGASNGSVTVNEHLDAEVSGGSFITYVGNPTLGSTKVSGGARLVHK
jgi:hypothetical protein